MGKNHIKLIIFDWDDVFTLGSSSAYYACYHEAMVTVGVELAKEEEVKRIKSNWGKPHTDELAVLLKERPELVDTAVEAYERSIFTETFSKHLSFVPRGKQFLEALRPRFKLALATGMNPRLLKENMMPKFDIRINLFDQIVTLHDLTDPRRGKPFPDMIYKILKTTGVGLESTIMVGDAKADVGMAQAAGVIPVVVLTGHLTKKEAINLGVKYILNKVTELEDVLDSIQGDLGKNK